MRAAFAHAQGLRLTRGGQLPFELFDAVAMSEEEADAMQTDVNVQRVMDDMLVNARR